MDFEETLIWKKAALIGRLVYELLPLLPPEERFGLRSQLSRAVISVSSNIAEGWARETQRDRNYFMVIAQSSLAEVRSQLKLCIVIKILTPDQIRVVVDEILQLAKMLTSLRQKMRIGIINEMLRDGRKLPSRYRHFTTKKPPPGQTH